MLRVPSIALALSCLVVTAATQTPGPSWPVPNAAGVPLEGFIPARHPEMLELGARVSVYLGTGEVVVRGDDVVIPGKGRDLVITRLHRSQVTYGGPFGWNSSHSYHHEVRIAGSNLEHLDGSRLEVDVYVPDGSGLYECQTPGVYRKARLDGAEWLIRDRDGSILRFHALDGSNTEGKLIEDVDRFGNAHTLVYDGAGRLSQILDTLNRPITFGYDGYGRVQTITDFAGRVTTYGYLVDDLETVAFPPIVGTPVGPDGLDNDFPSGKTLHFSYDATQAHNVATVTNPREYAASGAPVVSLGYQGDRVSSATLGTGTFQLTYTTPGAGSEAAQTTLVDRKGFTTELGFDVSGGLLRYESFTQGIHPNDPPSFATTYTLNAHGERLEEVLPAGDEIVCTFGVSSGDHFQRGNELTRKHKPAPGAPGGAKRLDWSNSFEPIYNQHLGSADGLATVLDYQEGLSSTTGLATLIADWGIDVGAFPLDLAIDKNGDGVQDQIGGNVVWQESPDITTGQPTPQKIIVVTTYDDAGRVLTRSSGEGAITVYDYATDAEGGLLEAKIEDADPALAPPTAGSAFWTKTVPHVHAVTRYERDAVGNVIEETDPRGVTTTYFVNEHNEVLLRTQGASLAAGADPVLTSMQALGWDDLAAPGFQTYYRYDENGNLVHVERENRDSGVPANPWLTTLYVYDIENRPFIESREILPGQWAITGYGYDANGNHDGTLYPRGNTDLSVYDERDLLYTHTRGASDPATASTTTYTYDLNGRPIEIEGPEDLDGDGLNEKTLYTYDGRGRLFKETSPVGTVTKRLYDEFDRDIGHEVRGQPGGPSPSANDTTGNVLLRRLESVRDEIGREVEVREKVFVPQGQSGTLPYTARATFVTRATQWDRDHEAVVTTDQNLAASTHTYDGLGRRLTTEDGEGNVVAYTYDAADNPTQEVVTEVNPIQPSNPEVKVRTSVYDALGRLVRKTDTLGRTTYQAYDSRGNVVAEADAKGPLASDPLGLVAGQINLPGNTERWLYDGLGRPGRSYADTYAGGSGNGADLFSPSFEPSIAPAGVIGTSLSSYLYDVNGNVDKVITDEAGQIDYDYDAQDRLERKTFPDGSYFETTYWRDGSVASHALRDAGDALFREIEMDYDGAGRLVSETVVLPGGTEIEGTLQRTYEYNGRGFVTASTDDNGPGLDSTVTRVLDSSGIRVQETQNGRVVSREFDDAGNRIALWYPDGRKVDFAYNDNYRLTDVDDGGVPIADVEYFGRARTARVSFANGLVQGFDVPKPGSGDTTGYDLAGSPVHLEHRDAGGGDLTDVTHDLDRNRNRVLEEQQIGAGPVVSDELTYDSLDRLENFQRNAVGANPPELDQTYTRDGDSSWLDFVIQAAGQAASTYTFVPDATWQYDSIGGNAVTYDLAGNRTGDAWFHYRYDAFDRLVRVAQKLMGGGEGVTVLTCAYDADGRRIEKASQFGTTRFSYEGPQLIEEREVSGALLAQHVFGDRVDELLQTLRDADGNPGLEPYYFLTNTLGSPIAVADAAGVIVERYDYDAYGAPRFLDGAGNPVPGAVSSAVGNAFLFTGREYDWELAAFKLGLSPYGYFSEWDVPVGQYFFRARYLDPSEGRFASRDPLALANNGADDPLPTLFARLTQGFVEGPYAYVSENPANATDPFGLADSAVVIDGQLYQGLGCLLDDAGVSSNPPRTTPAPRGGAAAGGAAASGGGGGGGVIGWGKKWGGKLWGLGKKAGVTLASPVISAWGTGLTTMFNPGKEIGKAVYACVSFWNIPAKIVGAIDEDSYPCPHFDDVIVLPGPAQPGGSGGGPTTPGPGGPGAPGGSPQPSTCTIRELHIHGTGACYDTGGPGDCIKPSKPTTPGPKAPGTPDIPPGSYPASSTRTRPCTPGGRGPTGPGGTGTPTSVHPKPCTPLPESTMKTPDGKYFFVMSCADAIAAGYTCEAEENQSQTPPYEEEEIDQKEVRAGSFGPRPRLAMFTAEPGESGGVRVRWAVARGADGGELRLERVDAEGGASVVLARRSRVDRHMSSYVDDDARASSTYRLVVVDEDGHEAAYGPIAPQSAVARAARTAMADRGRDVGLAAAPASVEEHGSERRRFPLSLMLLFGLFAVRLVSRNGTP